MRKRRRFTSRSIGSAGPFCLYPNTAKPAAPVIEMPAGLETVTPNLKDNTLTIAGDQAGMDAFKKIITSLDVEPKLVSVKVAIYIVPAEKNTTHTMLDAAVYDIPSRTMLFRAPGVDRSKGRATAVNLEQVLRKDSQTSFNAASVQLAKNLDDQLQEFREKVKESPDSIQVTHKPGYTGAGSVDGIMAVLAALFGGAGLWTHKRKKA